MNIIVKPAAIRAESARDEEECDEEGYVDKGYHGDKRIVEAAGIMPRMKDIIIMDAKKKITYE